MQTLFPVDPGYPSGFSYVPGFISREDEQTLVVAISAFELHNFRFQGFEAKRRVASFGYDYSFDKGALIKGKEIPPEFQQLLHNVAAHLKMRPGQFAELLITEYPPGAVINWHRDAPPFDLIAGISLHSDCTFKLRPYEKEKQTRNAVIAIPLQRRSLYVISGESRTEWQHSIAPVKQTRYSLTLRTLRS